MIKISYQPATRSSGWYNSSFVPKGLVLHSTAWPEMNAQAIRDYFNAPNRGASIHAAVDDTQVVQCFPWNKIAGHVGGSFNYSHIGVEMCEPKGLVYNSNGSAIVSYNPPEGYFKAVWNNAVDLFAQLCKQYNLDPLKDGVIVSHAEAYRRGVGSNHGDPEHWFRLEGVTMDDFRQAVNKKLHESEDEDNMDVKRFKELYQEMRKEMQDNDCSEWSAEAREWAISTGLVQGSSSGEPNFMWEDVLTREQLVAVLHRFAQMMGKA